VLVIIVLLCIWRGFKNGLIRGIAGIIALVISIFLANLVATAYSDDFAGMLSPFISGVVDTALGDTITSGSYVGGVAQPGSQGGAANSPQPSSSPAVSPSVTTSPNVTPSPGVTGGSKVTPSAGGQDSESAAGNEIYNITFATLKKIGLPDKATDLISKQVGGEVNTIGRELSGSISDKLSGSLAYVVIFAICFILLEIIFAVVGNLVNLIFSLPGLHGVDKIAGCVFGLAKGLVFVLVIALAIRYLGLVSSKTVDGTHILKYLINNNPIADMLGI